MISVEVKVNGTEEEARVLIGIWPSAWHERVDQLGEEGVWSSESVAETSGSVRRDSVGSDFYSVRKPTNYVCAKPPESRLRLFSNIYEQSGDIRNFPYICG